MDEFESSPESKQEPILAGTTIYFSSGEYSDYTVDGIYRVLKDIVDPDAIVKSCYTHHSADDPDERGYGCFNKPYVTLEFKILLTKLLGEGFIEEVPSREWHTDYFPEGI